MTDKDKLQVLYNYIKMIEPNARVYLDNNGVSADDFGSLYMKMYCNNSQFAAQSSGLHPEWLHKIFKMYRVSLSKVRDVIPSNNITIMCDRYYILEPRIERLFKDD